MGITGFVGLLKPAMRPCKIEDCKGLVLGVDFSIMMWKVIKLNYAAIEDYIFGEVERMRRHVKDVILVFDGQLELEAKKELREKRSQQRKKAGVTVGRTREIQNSIMEACAKYKVTHVLSPLEADAQLIKLVLDEHVDVIVTEDSDLVVYGAKKVLYKYKNGEGLLYESEHFHKCFNKPYNLDLLRAVAILRGSDYFVGGVFNFGPAAAVKLYEAMGDEFNFEKMVAAMNRELPENFEEKFWIAWNTFMYQLVLDIETGEVVPLHPYPPNNSWEDYPSSGNASIAKGLFVRHAAELPVNVAKSHEGFRLIYDCPISCRYCDSTFGNFEEMQRHRMMTHSAFSCPECNHVFRRYSELLDHIELHNPATKYPCTHCSTVLETPHKLMRHQRHVHTENPKVCTVCGKSFKNQTMLTCHLRVHAVDRGHYCVFCSKWFVNKTRFANHINMHTEERPYNCETCGDDFTQRTHLKTHQLRKHMVDRREYICTVCGKGFALKDDVMRHERTHGGEKPYLCGLCGKRFVQRGHLVRHTKTHVGDKPFKCEACGKCFTQRCNMTRHTKSCKKMNV